MTGVLETADQSIELCCPDLIACNALQFGLGSPSLQQMVRHAVGKPEADTLQAPRIVQVRVVAAGVPAERLLVVRACAREDHCLRQVLAVAVRRRT